MHEFISSVKEKHFSNQWVDTRLFKYAVDCRFRTAPNEIGICKFPSCSTWLAMPLVLVASLVLVLKSGESRCIVFGSYWGFKEFTNRFNLAVLAVCQMVWRLEYPLVCLDRTGMIYVAGFTNGTFPTRTESYILMFTIIDWPFYTFAKSILAFQTIPCGI